MADLTKFYIFPEHLAGGVHNLGTDTLKIALTNTAPDAAADTVFADITEISSGNGYTAGGATVTINSSGQTGGLYSLVGTDVAITASGGSVGPFRYAVFYNSSAANAELIGFWDYGSSITLADSKTFTVDFGASILTIA
jgi:hypothetical protein